AGAKSETKSTGAKSSETTSVVKPTEEKSGTSVSSNPKPASVTGTPFANHGALHVNGAYLYDKNNKKYQLYGMSTHGINFGNDFSRYVNKNAFQTLRDDWNTNCVRLVLYPRDYNGYCNGGNKSELKKIVCNGIDWATELGMYVIVDWHVHQYRPSETQNDAISFLDEISKKYSKYENVLYEICNEPTNSPWNSEIKPYAEKVIPVIRKNAPNAVVLVGTDTWSQDIEGPLSNPLSYKNVMYVFHFYANTHKDSYRTRVENAIKKGLPIFITEFGTCDASGNGGFNSAESKKWFELCKKYSISHMNWSLSNKAETASAISSSCSKTGGWTYSDLTQSGKLIYDHFRSMSR
ncbi:MAG: glycoside hydrolase family 5 protein, partial [Treponema sp.]|nr:glycoside hydrolase family 5 protein [Treponema sp.]